SRVASADNGGRPRRYRTALVDGALAAARAVRRPGAGRHRARSDHRPERGPTAGIPSLAARTRPHVRRPSRRLTSGGARARIHVSGNPATAHPVGKAAARSGLTAFASGSTGADRPANNVIADAATATPLP